MDHDGRIATSHTVETTYRQEVRDRVRALAALPNATVQSVLNDMRGVFPTDALAELRALAVDLPFVRSARVPAPSPVPDLHPLDYEWYFLENISEATASIFDGVSGTVACLGAPTVARELVSRGKRAILIDNNPLVLPRIGKHPLLQFLLHDISMRIELDAAFEGVFFDAPWYPEYAALWFWQAVRLSRPGTRIAFSLFPFHVIVMPCAFMTFSHSFRLFSACCTRPI